MENSLRNILLAKITCNNIWQRKDRLGGSGLHTGRIEASWVCEGRLGVNRLGRCFSALFFHYVHTASQPATDFSYASLNTVDKI